MTREIKVSVIIPNYNHARFLDQRITSVLNQAYQDFEVILLDDASTDNSRDVLQKYIEDDRVHADLNDANSGNTFVQWNRGVSMARGEYIWFAESDDFADEQFLERLVPVLDDHPKLGLVFCNVMVVDEDGNESETFRDHRKRENGETRWDTDFTANGRQACIEWFTAGNAIWNASSVLFRRSVFLAAGGADESRRLCGDWMTWVRMLLISDMAYVAEPLTSFRCHGQTVRTASRSSQEVPLQAYDVMRVIRSSIEVPPEPLEKSCQFLFNEWLSAIYSTKSVKHVLSNIRVYFMALRVDPRLHRRMFSSLFRRLRRKNQNPGNK